MNERIYRLAGTLALCVSGFAIGQGRILDMVADKIIAKYQNANCEQLWQQKGQPKSEQEERAVQLLRNDPQARSAFLNRVTAPIANKMFECGMIP